MRISDCSSDVCSSDLLCGIYPGTPPVAGKDQQSGSLFAKTLAKCDTKPGGGAEPVSLRGGAAGIRGRPSPRRCRHSRRCRRSEEHTSELQSLMRISYAVFCLKKKRTKILQTHTT